MCTVVLCVAFTALLMLSATYVTFMCTVVVCVAFTALLMLSATYVTFMLDCI